MTAKAEEYPMSSDEEFNDEYPHCRIVKEKQIPTEIAHRRVERFMKKHLKNETLANKTFEPKIMIMRKFKDSFKNDESAIVPIDVNDWINRPITAKPFKPSMYKNSMFEEMKQLKNDSMYQSEEWQYENSMDEDAQNLLNSENILQIISAIKSKYMDED
mmetsp:Transcript_14125/g.20886  ORF Transcript_14125/g.20886 Transcript_14125/m.20886 type:complete len:159 (+) Transcript_14125:88-564(+)